MKMWILNLGKPVTVPVLNEASAIELGANLLGEGILFVIAAAILINEYNRSARKEEKKERLVREEKELLSDTLQELYFSSQKQATQINELTRMIYDLEGRVMQKPWKPKKGPKSDDDADPPGPTPHAFCKPGPTFSDKDIDEERNQSNLILKAALDIEKEFWCPKFTNREPSLLYVAINHIYKDVYRLPMRL